MKPHNICLFVLPFAYCGLRFAVCVLLCAKKHGFQEWKTSRLRGGRFLFLNKKKQPGARRAQRKNILIFAKKINSQGCRSKSEQVRCLMVAFINIKFDIRLDSGSNYSLNAVWMNWKEGKGQRAEGTNFTGYLNVLLFDNHNIVTQPDMEAMLSTDADIRRQKLVQYFLIFKS